jgi:hypothetical protein
MLIFTEDYLLAIHANLDVNRTSNVYSATGHEKENHQILEILCHTCELSFWSLSS